MSIFFHEMRREAKAMFIWAGTIGALLLLCVIVFPQMQTQVVAINQLYANMGGLTAAFGMDKLDFGTAIGFYGVECGNILGIGGGMFAALLGISALAKEEKERTAEFLLSHPVSRARVVSEKLLALAAQILIFNGIILLVAALSFVLIGEDLPIRELALLHGAFCLLQLEIGAICLGISAGLRRGSLGIGIGLAMMLYFLNIIGNLSEKAEFIRYITPYRYAEPSQILPSGQWEIGLMLLGLVYALLGIGTAYLWYSKKDIAV